MRASDEMVGPEESQAEVCWTCVPRRLATCGSVAHPDRWSDIVTRSVGHYDHHEDDPCDAVASTVRQQTTTASRLRREPPAAGSAAITEQANEETPGSYRYPIKMELQSDP